MIIKNFGIILSQLTTEDIELVRYWRNSKEISRFMEYRKFISEEQQKIWFQSLNPTCDFYFLINYKGVKVGMIHTSAIDWKEKTAQAGLFVWDSNYLGTHIPVLASLAMLECFFQHLRIEKYYAKVGRENLVAIRYNAALGFKLLEKSKDSAFDFYVLEKQEYEKLADKLKVFAEKFNTQKPEMLGVSELMKEIEKQRSESIRQ